MKTLPAITITYQERGVVAKALNELAWRRSLTPEERRLLRRITAD